MRMKNIHIITGDITDFEGDVLVNPTNSSPFLRGEGGLDAIVIQKAGQLLLPTEEIKVGEVISTPSYDMTKIKAIYHTVGPRYKEGNWEEDKDLLRSCYRNCMERLLEDGYTSIAFPFISTGTFGCPKDEVFSLAIDEAEKFIKNHEDQSEKLEITFYKYNEDDTNE